MSTEEDLLNDFFAEINSLPTPSLSVEPEKKKVLIWYNHNLYHKLLYLHSLKLYYVLILSHPKYIDY